MRLLCDIYICVYFGASWTMNKQKSVIRICAMMWHSLFTLAMRFVIGCRNGRPIATETVWRLLHGGRCRGTLRYLQAGGQSAHCNRTTACGEERTTVTGHFHPKFPLLSPPPKKITILPSGYDYGYGYVPSLLQFRRDSKTAVSVIVLFTTVSNCDRL